jgi:two-component system nitrate/nitrite response regulator NarL
MFREGLVRILSAADFHVAAAGSSIADISPDQVPHDQPILLVIDVTNGQAAVLREIELFKQRYPNDRIALLSDDQQLDDDEILDAFRAGILAYFAKPNCDTFIKCLELVMLGETILPPHLMSAILQNQDKGSSSGVKDHVASTEPANGADDGYAPKLSLREICILRCLISGDSNKTIARSYSIAEATVKVHVKAILRKIRVRNRTQAAIWALNHNMVVGSAGEVLATPLAAADAPYRRSRNGEAGPLQGDAPAVPIASDPLGRAAAMLIGRGRNQI